MLPPAAPLRLDRPRAASGWVLAGLLLGLLAFALGIADFAPRLLALAGF